MNIENLIRENIKKLKAYSSARGNNLQGILLDANENGFGSTIDSSEKLNRYPDPNQIQIRSQLADYLNVSYENLILGVGSDEILDLIVRIFCNPGIDNVIINEPTYGMYKVICDINDIEVNSVKLNNEYQLDLQKIYEKVNENTKLIFICSPNNPTGNLINKKDIIELAKNVNAIIVVDEAYIDFEDESLINNNILDNIIITRTFSKAWGLAGVRCGYCYADKKIIETLLKVKAPYNLSSLTIETISEALSKSDKKDQLVNLILSEKEKIISFLNKCKFVKKIFATSTNYILIRVFDSTKLLKYLKKQNIIIRDRSNQISLENCVRISIGNSEENNLLIAKMREYDEKNISV